MPAELLPSELPANEQRDEEITPASPAPLPSDPSAEVSPTALPSAVPNDTVLAAASRLSPAEGIAGGTEEVAASETPESDYEASPSPQPSPPRGEGEPANSSPPAPLPQGERGENEARRELHRELLRARLLDRLDRSRRLPPGLKQRLLAEVPAAAAGADGSELPHLRLSDAIVWLEESLPPHVSLAPDALARPDHPRGDHFFQDDISGLTDAEAERIAREQVRRAGLGKK